MAQYEYEDGSIYGDESGKPCKLLNVTVGDNEKGVLQLTASAVVGSRILDPDEPDVFEPLEPRKVQTTLRFPFGKDDKDKTSLGISVGKLGKLIGQSLGEATASNVARIHPAHPNSLFPALAEASCYLYARSWSSKNGVVYFFDPFFLGRTTPVTLEDLLKRAAAADAAEDDGESIIEEPPPF